MAKRDGMTDEFRDAFPGRVPLENIYLLRRYNFIPLESQRDAGPKIDLGSRDPRDGDRNRRDRMGRGNQFSSRDASLLYSDHQVRNIPLIYGCQEWSRGGQEWSIDQNSKKERSTVKFVLWSYISTMWYCYNCKLVTVAVTIDISQKSIFTAHL